MATEGLFSICAGLGLIEVDGSGKRVGYAKGDNCLDNLKDLVRFLRRDDPQTRDVFKKLCEWNIVASDLIPIVEQYRDDRDLVLNSVKVLVFLSMPIDPSSTDIDEQLEYLWKLKSVITYSDAIAVVVSLLEGPLENLERDELTEDDRKLVQLVMTLFRNILAVKEISAHQKAEGSANHFLALGETFLALLFRENVMDLIIVLTKHIGGYQCHLRQDNLLFLNIFHHIFSDVPRFAIMEDGSQIINSDILASLEKFTDQFLSGAYNVLMQSIREDIEEYNAIQHSDVVIFFQLAQFAISVQYYKFIRSEPPGAADTMESPSGCDVGNTSSKDNICGPIAETLNQSMFELVISKWRYALECLKETKDYELVSRAGSLMKTMIRVLDLVLKQEPVDSKEHQTACILLSKLFYGETDQGLIQFLLTLIKSFDAHKPPKSDLDGLEEMVHIIRPLTEYLQTFGKPRAIEETYGYWAHLPRDLLIDIAKRLKSVEDMAAFASVCSSWKYISRTVKLKWTPAMPWLMLPNDTEDVMDMDTEDVEDIEDMDTEDTKDKPLCKWTLFNPSTKKLYNMELPETFGGSSWGCIDGWICTLDLELEFHLFNPLTKARLCLPSAFTLPMIEGDRSNYILPAEWFRRNCIITSLTMVKTPLNNELLVFVMYNKIYVCFAKPGDSMWTALECYDELDEDEDADTDEDEDDSKGIFVETVVGFNGQILVLYEDGKLASLGKSDGFLTDKVDFIAEGYVLSKETVDSIAEVYVPGDLGGVVSRYGHSTPVNFNLVESFGDLFLVLQHLKNPGDNTDSQAYLSRQFEVFKFNSRANNWVKWDDLGDVSLFVGLMQTTANPIAYTLWKLNITHRRRG